MRVLGLDSSSKKCGYALIVDGEPIVVETRHIDLRLNQPERALRWGRFVASAIAIYQPDIVAIEECMPTRNAKTFRTLMRFEAVAGYEARIAKKMLLLIHIKTARKVVVGNGNMPKEDVFSVIRDRYPQFGWLPIDKGGDDMSDALVVGVAAETIAARAK